jgi:transcriptional regulator with XRE-family HTH domain
MALRRGSPEATTTRNVIGERSPAHAVTNGPLNRIANRERPDIRANPDMGIGEQLRELRHFKGLTLQEVATAAGISVGYLSQIERNQSRLPFGVFKHISDCLGVQPDWFFQQATKGSPTEHEGVVRANNRRTMSFTGLGITEQLLSPNLSGSLKMLLSTLEPGANSDLDAHDGEEVGVVLSGTLDLWIAGRHFKLNTGDSFAVKSSQGHRCANRSAVATQVLWVVTPSHY